MAFIESPQFRVQEADVERGIVYHQLGTAHEIEEFRGYLRKQGLVGEEFTGDAMHFDGALVNVALGIDIAVEVVPGQAPVHQFDTADFNDPVALVDLQAGRFRIQYNQSHRRSSLSPGLQFIDAPVGQLVGNVVLPMATVALDPVPLDPVTLALRIQRLPQVDILDR